ncbi:MAG: hypothetical protein IPQ08_01100 [Chitinophagaceae bacterium]|nr:hypothetical protein [Chitinophagaceae bacterium]
MYQGLLHLHSTLRWVILILLLIAVYNSIANRNKDFTKGHRSTGLFLLIAADITLLIGLYQWIQGGLGLKAIQANGMAATMKDPVSRFFVVEHTIGMLVAIILVHVAYSYSKKAIPGPKKHKRNLLLYGLALLIVLISIPWPNRIVGIARPLFPGM